MHDHRATAHGDPGQAAVVFAEGRWRKRVGSGHIPVRHGNAGWAADVPSEGPIWRQGLRPIYRPFRHGNAEQAALVLRQDSGHWPWRRSVYRPFRYGYSGPAAGIRPKGSFWRNRSRTGHGAYVVGHTRTCQELPGEDGLVREDEEMLVIIMAATQVMDSWEH